MISQQQQQISTSTRFRFKRVGRETDLPAFLEFKKEYQNSVSKSKIEQLKHVYQHAILSRNSNHQTVLVDRIGSLSMVQVNKILDDQGFFAYMCQRMLFLSEKVLKEKEQVVWVVDLSGKIMQLASKRIYALLYKFLPILQKFFPQVLYRLYFVNTPMLFDTIWNKLSPKIAQKTAEKVIFLADQLTELYQDADQSILPQCLGGYWENNKVFSSLPDESGQAFQFREEEEQQEQEIDMSSLKQALSGLKIGGHNHPSVASTPLNTEADDYKKKQ